MENTFKINNIIVDASFKDFIIYSSCRVAMVIKGFEMLPDINYLAVGDKPDTVSYLPTSKSESVILNSIDPYSDGIGRVTIKVGRLVFKLFSKEIISLYISPSDIEEFVNNYKSFFDISDRKLIVVSGEDIRKYYLDEYYSYPDHGTLWKSCMRYKERQKFLDIYVFNEDKVKMLVLIENDKVRGRALLWEAEDLTNNKMKIMDRIYTIYDSDVFIFKKWARENGYISKFYQNAKTQNIFNIDDKEVYLNLKITLQNHLLGTYPYLDSFQFYNVSSGTFYNNTNRNYDYTLIQFNGNPYPPERDENDLDIDDDMIDVEIDEDHW